MEEKRRCEESRLTVRSGSTALLGSSSGLLASSSTLLHIHVHTSSSFGLGNENLGSLLVDASAVLDGIVGFVEVTGNGLTVDLCEGWLVEVGSERQRRNTHFTAVRGDDGGDKALHVLKSLPVGRHVGDEE